MKWEIMSRPFLALVKWKLGNGEKNPKEDKWIDDSPTYFVSLNV